MKMQLMRPNLTCRFKNRIPQSVSFYQREYIYDNSLYFGQQTKGILNFYIWYREKGKGS